MNDLAAKSRLANYALRLLFCQITTAVFVLSEFERTARPLQQPPIGLVVKLGEIIDGVLQFGNPVVRHKACSFTGSMATPFYDFIQKKRSESKRGKEVMIAGLNKFLCIYYSKVVEIYSNAD